MNKSFFIKDTVKFLQIKQDTIRQECCQKHEKSVSPYVDIKHDTPLPYTQLYTFWMTPSLPTSCVSTELTVPLSQPKNINIFEYHIY